jgi:membrane-bound lytic murein transglycosylase B
MPGRRVRCKSQAHDPKRLWRLARSAFFWHQSPMMRYRVLVPLLFVAACATPPKPPAPPPPPPPVVAPPPPVVKPVPSNADFDLWLAGYRRHAIERGVPAASIDQLLAGVTLSQRAIDLDRRQPGDASSGAAARFDSYLARQVDAARINGGTAAANRLAPTIAGVQAKTGVPGEIFVAIWGLESAYGKVTGNFDVPSALATLAWEGRRKTLFTNELDAALTIIDQKKAPRSALRGSWAGAMGQPQFLPSSYLTYAADGDGDGKADIWSSEADTLASIGNYLKLKGWQPGLPWGLKVSVPEGFDRLAVKNPERPKTCVKPLERHSKAHPVSQWKAWGLTGTGRWPADDVLAVLIEPDGPGQGAYLTTANYRVIMEYNCSNFYALSVALLGDAIAGRAR